MHIYRWDLDKTYLDTDIESVRGLVRTALETAKQKRNVPGSAALMRALIQSDPNAKVHILSGSPTQMREVLEEKLALDGVNFDSLTLKDNLGNLRKRRFRAVRGQLGYKLPVLLEQRVGIGAAVSETLFGDDSEVDALIYSLYADAVAGRIDEAELGRVLDAGRVYRDSQQTAIRALRHLGQADVVQDIFIHIDHGPPVREYARLGPRVKPVFSWLQAALVLWERGRLQQQQVMDVLRACTDEARLSEHAVAGLLQDSVRRHLTTPERVELLLNADELGPIAPSVRRALSRLGKTAPPKSPAANPDYVGFLQVTGH